MLAALAAVFVYFPQPPLALQHDGQAHVKFMARGEVTAACEALGAPEAAIAACTKGSLIVLPNPCQWPLHEAYAELACHELGHRNEPPGSGNWHAKPPPVQVPAR